MTWGQLKEKAAKLAIPDSAIVDFDSESEVGWSGRRYKVQCGGMTAYCETKGARDRTVAAWSLEREDFDVKWKVAFVIGINEDCD